ncbi:indole-3-glycerol-phosphate synthase TrpC, partial [Faecalibacillus intestinalis]|nr:indole-3-glycerol-phosphate synthase TrpC [Faecalibacillus intestinalis]
MLSVEQLTEYRQLAESLGMDALVEAHNEFELQRALKSGARIVGVNNRNLKDFTVDPYTSIQLRGLVPDNVLFVSESGIKTAAAIQELKDNRV